MSIYQQRGCGDFREALLADVLMQGVEFSGVAES